MHVTHTYKLIPPFFGGKVHICPSNKTKIQKKKEGILTPLE